MRKILLSLTALAMSTVPLLGQSLSGRVFDDTDGRKLAGVLVSFENTDLQITTAFDGTYTLSIPEYGGIVTFSLDGYTTQSFNVLAEKTIDVFLVAESSSDEISIGFGSVSKSELTSSVAQVSGDVISNQPVQDLGQANQGRASGLFVQNNGGKLGQGTTVRVRGGSSLTSSNEPLYVVDGVPLTSNSQSEINPNNIASIEILKDASAAAIYGSRAANGVVLITTKKGTSGKLKIDFDYQFGTSQTPKKLDLLSADQYRAQFLEYGLREGLSGINSSLSIAYIQIFLSGDSTLYHRFYPQMELFEQILADGNYENYLKWAKEGQFDLSDGSVVQFDDSEVLNLIPSRLDSNKYQTDWQNEVFRTALTHRANLNLSGGNENLSFFGGVGYTSQEGILVGNKFDRINLDFNLAGDRSKPFSYQLGGNYIYSKNYLLPDDQDLGSPLQAILLPPSDSYDPTDDYRLLVRKLEYNPLTEINNADYQQSDNRFIGNAAFTYRLTEELALHLDGGIDYYNSQTERRQGPQTLGGNPTGFSRISSNSSFNYLTNLYADYSKLLGGQKFSITVGTSYQQSSTDFAYSSARVNDLVFGESATGYFNNPIPSTGNKLLSFFGRTNYNVLGKYILQLSARADGSSKFGQNNQFGYFPAASLGWLVSEESFLSGVSAIDLLKLRGSFGIVGNTPSDDFLYRLNYYQIKYGDGQEGIRLSNLGNQDLKWETTQQIDAGLDFAILHNRISGSVNYYQKNTTDLLFPVPVSQTSGFQFAVQNYGSMNNQGMEVELTTVNIQQDNLYWSTSFNVTTNENQITDLGGRRLISGVNAFLENQPAGVYFTPVFVGVDDETGQALYKDGDGGETTDYDEALANGREVIGNPNPKVFGGMLNQISMGSFDVNFNVTFVQGVDKYFQTGEFLANSGILNLNQSVDQIDRWYKSGDDALFPGLDPAQDNTFPSSRWIVDGSYVRINNLMIAYNLPDNMISQWGMRYFKVYIGGQNLYTFSNYPGYDPDSNYIDPLGGAITSNINRGIDDFTAPQPRVFTTGIKIGF